MQAQPRFTNTKTQQTGSTLIIALILLAVMSLLGLSAMNNSIVQESLTSNFQNGSIALNHAETGIADALAKINTDDLTANELLTAVASSANYIDKTSGADGIRYVVNVTDNVESDGNTDVDTDEILLITSTGTIANSERTVQVRINLGNDYWSPKHALLTQEFLDIPSQSEILGTNRDLHSNTGMNIGNKNFSAGHASTVGTIAKNPTAPDSYEENASEVFIPDIIPSDFKSRATHILKNDGAVEVRGIDAISGAVDNSVTPITSKTSSYDGWEYTAASGPNPMGTWQMKSNTPVVPGIFYAEGNIKVAGTPGKGAAPDWNVSLIAEGSIEISGSAYIKTYDDSHPGGKILLLAGEDIKLNGSSDIFNEGLIAARDHITFSGQVNLEGNVISQGISGAGGKQLSTKDTLNGQITLTYNGGSSPFVNPDAGLNTLSWAQVLN